MLRSTLLLPGRPTGGRSPSSRDGNGSNDKIYVIERRRQRATETDRKAARSPLWSPDGRKIAFPSKRDGN